MKYAWKATMKNGTVYCVWGHADFDALRTLLSCDRSKKKSFTRWPERDRMSPPRYKIERIS